MTEQALAAALAVVAVLDLVQLALVEQEQHLQFKGLMVEMDLIAALVLAVVEQVQSVSM
jgi:hypothetical protein